MGFIKIWFWGRSVSVRQPQKRQPGRKRPEGTGTGGRTVPIRSVRKKYWLRGEEYSVVLNPDAQRNTLRIDGRTFVVSLRPATRENFDRFMQEWYRRQARKAFQDAVDRWLPRFAAAGRPVPPPRIKIFAMRRAWGRCYYTKGLITLNLHLVKTPQACIDYIVLHELCHFVVSNHSKAFHRQVEALLPDWREADSLLKTFARERRIVG